MFSYQPGLSDWTWKMAMMVGRKSAVVAGVEMFMFVLIAHGTWIMPGTRIPPSHDEALHCRMWLVE